MEIQESKQIQLISDIKDKIKAAQYRALLNVNEQLIRLYWDIGNDLNENTEYGNRFISSQFGGTCTLFKLQHNRQQPSITH